MRILVLSDTHGDFYSMMKAIDATADAEVIIHCGDGREQIETLIEKFPEKQIIAVRGNCDWGSRFPDVQTAEVAGKTIFVTHGNLYQVKFSPYQLICAGRENHADIVCFGHTHCAMTDYEDGMYILNPGSCHGYGATFGVIDITPKGEIVTNIVKVDDLLTR
ncbi:MAG: metallophosphoesterase [Ruminococcus sp.]|nr:metallophosphoesterase [Ruminococcus sp.]